MEKVLHNSPLLEIPTDIVDDKYVSGLSTILVTTIQETKDRISQIEYIFCSQLFPSFQSNSKSLQKIYHEAKKAAEDEWKENEKALLLQIKKLQSEKQQTLEENQSLKLENAKYIEFGGLKRMIHLEDDLRQKTREVDKARELQQSLLELLESKASIILDNEKLVKELENEKSLLLKKQRSLELEAEGLRLELTRKSKEVDGGMELQNKLLQLIQSKTSLIVHKEKQMKEREEKTNGTIAKIKNLEEKVGKLQEEVDKKNQEVETGKNLQQELLRRIESQTSKIVTYEEMSKNLRRKIEEVEEGRKMREEMHKQIELKNSEILKIEQEVEELRKERELNMGKLKHLEGKVDKLLADLKERNNDSVEGMELHGKLLQQIEAKDLELLSEKNKRRDVIAAYKRLKSQYTYLCAKFGLTTEDMIPWGTKEDESDPLRREQILLSSPDTENMVPCEMTKQKDETPKSKDQIGFRLIQKSSLDSPSHSQTPIPYPKCSTTSKSGSKRPVSSWRDTRSHQKRAGPDPHDDFLDTPLDNIVGNSKKITKEVHDLADPVPKDMVFDTSDDETQDMNIDPGPEKQPMQAPRPGLRGYKYVEPVRKKADKENLKGVECKQCKKFYDAVLVNGGDKQQCEHHNGVSRHRYRYAPPLTPEGFWNIGFESEM